MLQPELEHLKWALNPSFHKGLSPSKSHAPLGVSSTMEAEQIPIKLQPSRHPLTIIQFCSLDQSAVVFWGGGGTCWEEAILCKPRACGPH